MQNGIYVLNQSDEVYNITMNKRKRGELNMSHLWHLRMGHINEDRIDKMVKGGYLDQFQIETLPTCKSCLKGKMTRSSFSGQGDRASVLLGLIHTDVCGPMTINARGGFSYFITFTDDISRYGYVYLMKHKSESFEKFKEYKNEVENQLGLSIKILRSDRGGEYLSSEFISYLKECGIKSQWTPPGTPQMNGVSERRNRTLLDMVRSMMSDVDLPESFWGFALETATHLLNLAPTKSVSTTPYEIWRGER